VCEAGHKYAYNYRTEYTRFFQEFFVSSGKKEQFLASSFPDPLRMELLTAAIVKLFDGFEFANPGMKY
jgi:hypothetical protein